MWEAIKKMINWTSRIMDLSGSKTSKRINDIYNRNIMNGFKTDRRNISSDFNNAIIKVSK